MAQSGNANTNDQCLLSRAKRTFAVIFKPEGCDVVTGTKLVRNSRSGSFPGGYLVGAAGFEPTTPCLPDKCANRAALRPDRNGADYRDAIYRGATFGIEAIRIGPRST